MEEAEGIEGTTNTKKRKKYTNYLFLCFRKATTEVMNYDT